MESLSPGQQVVKIVHEELTNILSAGDHRLTPASQLPSVLMLVGLQGSGQNHHGRQARAANEASAAQRHADCRGPSAGRQPSPSCKPWANSWTFRCTLKIPKSATPAKVAAAGSAPRYRVGPHLGHR